MEQLFWRKLSNSFSDPVCHFSEGIWIRNLLKAQHRPTFIAVTRRNLVTPDQEVIPSLTITKCLAHRPTSIVVDCNEPLLLGAILGLYSDAHRPLRPLRPDVRYTSDSEFGLHLMNMEAYAGFDESDPLIEVFMELLKRLNIPANPKLPEIVSSYWPE